MMDEPTVAYDLSLAPWLGRISFPSRSRDGVTPGNLYTTQDWHCPAPRLCRKNTDPGDSAWADCRCYLLATYRAHR